jgi:uncharacterized cupin superfamily protein
VSDVVNVFEVELEKDQGDPDGYHTSYKRLGPLIGGAELGMSLYRLPPGQSVCPYHYEYGREELLLVLEGRPTLRTPDGEEEVVPGDVVVFPEGPAGAHKLTNPTDEAVLLTIMSTKADPTVAVYPDSNKIAAWSSIGSDDDIMARRGENLDYWDGEV